MMREIVHIADVVLTWFFGSPFWRGVIGGYIGNFLFSIPIGGIVIWLVKLLAHQAWSKRHAFFLWGASSALVFLILLALRFNTASIVSARLSADLVPRTLTDEQSSCISNALLAHTGVVQLSWAPGNAEAFNYALDFQQAMDMGKWSVTSKPEKFYPNNGVLISFDIKLYQGARFPLPPDVDFIKTTLEHCGIQVQVIPDTDITGQLLYVGNKPVDSLVNP